MSFNLSTASEAWGREPADVDLQKEIDIWPGRVSFGMALLQKVIGMQAKLA